MVCKKILTLELPWHRYHLTPKFNSFLYNKKLEIKGFSMQKIIIEVKDNYAFNVLEMFHGLKGVMIEKIKFDSSNTSKIDLDFMKVQRLIF
jgi:hypothetical protein